MTVCLCTILYYRKGFVTTTSWFC